jgi:hypothetical protein
MFKEYHKIDESFKNFNDFFDQFANGKREGAEIESRLIGYNNDAHLFWLGEDEYPFAYTFPRQIVNDGFIFYIREDKII